MRAAGSLRAKPSLALGPPDRDVVASDDADQNFDVSVRQVLGGHLLPLFPLRLQRPPGFSQLEQVDSQNSEKNEGEKKKKLYSRDLSALELQRVELMQRRLKREDLFYRQQRAAPGVRDLESQQQGGEA